MEEIKATDKVIIIIGRTGVGKSTLVNGLVGNRLIAYKRTIKDYEEKEDNKKDKENEEYKNIVDYDDGNDSNDSDWSDSTNEYVLDVDKNDTGHKKSSKIGHTNISETTVPWSYIDEKSGITYYDCPGFSDTKNSEQGIINSVFIK